MASAMAEETREFETDSFVRGYHVCWTPVIGARIEEQPVCEGEKGNPRDRKIGALILQAIKPCAKKEVWLRETRDRYAVAAKNRSGNLHRPVGGSNKPSSDY